MSHIADELFGYIYAHLDRPRSQEHRAMRAMTILTPEQAGNAEIKKLRAENARLRALVKDLADDLESELKAHYDGTLQYPGERRRFERDMDSVYRARAALAAKDTKPPTEIGWLASGLRAASAKDAKP